MANDPRPTEKAAAEPVSSPGEPAKSSDVALVHGVSADGKGLEIIRARDGQLTAGSLRALEPGKPIHGEVLRLRPRPEFPLVCDVDVELDASEAAPPAAGRKGPAQVATESYRRNWEAIWSGRNKSELSN